MNKEIIASAINALKWNEKEVLVSSFEFNTNKENEFLIFFKPEVFFSWDENLIWESIKMVLAKLEENEIEVGWAILFKWDRLDELGIMDRHYWFINKVSKNISKIATQEEKEKMYQLLEITDPEEYTIYGWHEFLASHKEFSEESLDELWLTKKSAKVRSGFYIQKYDVNWEKVILVNAFHPVQLKHYTDTTHKTLVLLCRSNQAWNVLKDNVAWDTFPERSVRESVRWEFFANKDKYWINEVSISFNCIHMSAWPFEALFEINNFLKDCSTVDFDLTTTNLSQKILSTWLSKDSIINSLTNPKNTEGGSLFDVTENMSTNNAVNLFVGEFN